jgi:hypothetical protein
MTTHDSTGLFSDAAALEHKPQPSPLPGPPPAVDPPVFTTKDEAVERSAPADTAATALTFTDEH